MKVTLQGMRCLKTTESDGDEIYCVVTVGGDRREVARFDVGDFDVGETLHPGIALGWNGRACVTITVMEAMNGRNTAAR